MVRKIVGKKVINLLIIIIIIKVYFIILKLSKKVNIQYSVC